MNNFTKGILMVVAVVTCIIVAGVSMRGTKNAKSAFDKRQKELDILTTEFTDSNLAIYDEASLNGSALIEFIEETKATDTKVAIKVITKSNTDGVSYGYEYTASTSKLEKSSNELETDIMKPNYINRSAQFIGEVTKNTNGNIVQITFTQQ